MYKKIVCFALALAGASAQLMSAESHSAAASFRGYASSTDIDDTEIEASTSPLTTMSACGESDLDYTPFATFNEWDEPNFSADVAEPAAKLCLSSCDPTTIHPEAFSYVRRNAGMIVSTALLYAMNQCRPEDKLRAMLIDQLSPQAEGLLRTCSSAEEFLVAAMRWAAGERIKSVIAAILFEYAHYHSMHSIEKD